MASNRPSRERAQEPSTADRIRQLADLVGRALEKPRPIRRARRIDAVRRSWLASFLQARASVRAGVPLDEFLRSRLTCYLAALPVPPARLPLDVAVSEGQVVARPADRAPEPETPPTPTPSAGAGDDPQRWLAPLVAVEGPGVRQEVTEILCSLSLLEGERAVAQRRADELSRRFAADVAAGAVTAPSLVEATAEQLGRPPVRGRSGRAALAVLLAASFLATAWLGAIPLLRAADLDPYALRAAAERRPVELAFVAVLSLGVAAGLFALADAALVLAARLFRGEDDRRRLRLLAVGVGAAASLPVFAGAALATLRPAAIGAPGWAFVLLLVALSAGGALLLGLGRADAKRRALDAAAALAWDRERAQALEHRGRRLEEIDWATAEILAVERRRGAARRRLRDVNARVVQAARLDAEAAERERADLARFAQTLVAALDLDRFEFIRQASARGAGELLAPLLHKPARGSASL